MAYYKMPNDVDGMDAVKRLNDDVKESLNKYKDVSNKIMNVMADYDKNSDYWSAVSGVAVGLEFNDTRMGDLALRINTNMYDDTDQGYMNSRSIWAQQTGKDKVLEQLGKEEADAYKQFEGAVKNKVNDILGKYGNKKIEGHATASSTMLNQIINSSIGNLYGAFYADEARQGPSTQSSKESVKTARSIVAKLSIGGNDNRAWNLIDAVNNCGLGHTDFKDMTDSDWKQLSNELSKLERNV